MHNAPLTAQAKRSFLLLDDTEFGSGFAWLASKLQIVCPSDSSCSYHAYDFDLAGRPNDNHPLRGWNGKNTPSMEETVAVITVPFQRQRFRPGNLTPENLHNVSSVGLKLTQVDPTAANILDANASLSGR
ncbi:hypothetical protein BFJ70_g12189 [Fusarium oxysporum]|nr:hypothetical protein BFJ70_g12189 [Fusarium oxysporum]